MRIGILSAQLGREDVHENKRLVREIRRKGHRPVIINYRRTVLAIHKNKRTLYQPDKKGVLRQVNVDAVIPRINEASDKSTHLATLALDCLISGGAYSTANPASIKLAKNKISSLVALAAAGVPIPRSAAITGTESFEIDVDKVLNKVEPSHRRRLIVKTNSGTYGKGVMPAESRGDARAIMDGFLINNIPVLIQQFVEPTKKGVYVDLRYIVVNGQVVASMKRLSSGKDEVRANISLGGKGEPHEPTDTEIELAKQAAKAIGLGVAGVDIIPSGRKRLVIEVNTSPGFVIEKVTGSNVAKKIVQMAISGARKGERTAAQKLIDALSTDVPIKLIKPVVQDRRAILSGVRKSLTKPPRRNLAKK